MPELFYDDNADLSIIQGRNVAVIGYGSQGHAHALNLRDSGVDVRVGLKEGSKSRAKAEAEGLRVLGVAEAVEEADVVVILTPDQVQRTVYAEDIAPNLVAGDALVFGHGFNIRFGYIQAPEGVDVVLVAPKAPGHTVRREFVAGRGIPDIILDKVKAIPIGKGMAGIAAERKQPVQVCNLQTDASGVAKPGAKETKMEGSITVPMMLNGVMLGTLGIAKPVPYEFNEEECATLMEIGTILATFTK